MHQQNANIREFSRPLNPAEKLRKQIRAVLLVMSILTGVVAATAFFIAGPRAMLAASCGGLSQIVAVWAYGRISRSDGIPAPKTILARFLLAEIAKIVIALVLLLAGYLFFGAHVLWFAAAFVVVLAAYLLVLISK
ncbi:ATP synthase subunit I [Chitinimonas sp. BJYL2]|uniref:ATP synthase subunit I n=1 Tax=Chitinimonas sp. BJYL2 TaxID=2976696 RepID=UPI0022B37D4C|nr:ATP synthase subunit I [Chitinimonas sp. BJYL2]